jgi:hypothetical protein
LTGAILRLDFRDAALQERGFLLQLPGRLYVGGRDVKKGKELQLLGTKRM